MPDRLNVLWIQTDELRADALGCYGPSPWAPPQTPDLDALAARGVLFRETYCNSPVCVSSRTSMLTGRYPHETGVYHNEAAVNGHVLPRRFVTFPQAFQAAGYDTINVGKIHTPKNPTWSRILRTARRGDGGYGAFTRNHGSVAQDAVVMHGPPYVVISAIYPLGPGETTPTTDLTNAALECLEAKRGSSDPWMLRVSYTMPHTPVMPPQRFADRFDPAGFPFDEARDRSNEAMSPFERFVSEAQRADELSPEEISRARLHYWAVMTHVDEEVGRLMAKLDDLGVTGRTIVVFDADHGAMLGEMGLWQKQIYNRTVHRVPQIMACPGVLPEGAIRDDLNELMDRGATLYNLCGVPRPDGFRGRDLFGDEPAPEAHYAIIGYGQPDSLLYPLVGAGPRTPRRACVRTPQWRYDVSIRLNGRNLPPDDPMRQPCLIDRVADPAERVNRSGQAETASIEQSLAAQLDEWLALDAGIIDPPTS